MYEKDEWEGHILLEVVGEGFGMTVGRSLYLSISHSPGEPLSAPSLVYRILYCSATLR